ncbi:hypothetical protein OG939_35780 [Streptomyces sp. NBC_01685]|uniref:hypothetical protein n=1 Tax=Streptomyces sp. NBC_01685 TaxID=2975910 RepID=UPI002E309A40|nr:hypothetical protein [Streptomyces sp. NBC_01685]
MSEVAEASTVTASYAQKVTQDLAVTRSEQERVRAELTRLQDELRQLEESEQVLVKVQVVLADASGSASGQNKKKASVPSARRGKASAAQVKASGKAKSSKAGAKTAAKEAAPAKDGSEETWAALASGYLTVQGEPKSAAEVTAALSEAHPQRKVQATVVRNALEQGVARGLLERSKQGRSVYYTPAATVPASPEPAAAL